MNDPLVSYAFEYCCSPKLPAWLNGLEHYECAAKTDEKALAPFALSLATLRLARVTLVTWFICNGLARESDH